MPFSYDYCADVAMMAVWNSSVRQVICFDICRHTKVCTILCFLYFCYSCQRTGKYWVVYIWNTEL